MFVCVCDIDNSITFDSYELVQHKCWIFLHWILKGIMTECVKLSLTLLWRLLFWNYRVGLKEWPPFNISKQITGETNNFTQFVSVCISPSLTLTWMVLLMYRNYLMLLNTTSHGLRYMYLSISKEIWSTIDGFWYENVASEQEE